MVHGAQSVAVFITSVVVFLGDGRLCHLPCGLSLGRFKKILTLFTSVVRVYTGPQHDVCVGSLWGPCGLATWLSDRKACGVSKINSHRGHVGVQIPNIRV